MREDAELSRSETTRVSDGASEGAGGRAAETFYCDLCGNVMLEIHCKLICERCGYKRDCSDP